MSLNNRAIQAAPVGALLRDTVIPGLHLRVFPNKKSFYLYYRTKEGRERRPKLGDYGIISIDQARKQARELLARVAEGRDPSAELDRTKAAPTIADLAQRYLNQHADKKKKQRSRKEDERQIKKYLLPRIGTRKVHETQHEDIEKIHALMQDTPYQANRLLALTSKMFTLAEK